MVALILRLFLSNDVLDRAWPAITGVNDWDTLRTLHNLNRVMTDICLMYLHVLLLVSTCATDADCIVWSAEGILSSAMNLFVVVLQSYNLLNK